MIFIGSDHAGYQLKQVLCHYISETGKQFVDVGVDSEKSSNYAPIAKDVAFRVVSQGQSGRGILVCGSGIGMSISANRVKGARAALCEDVERAKLCRAHNDANILCLGGRFITEEDAIKTLDTFLSTIFEGGRHEERVKSMEEDPIAP